MSRSIDERFYWHKPWKKVQADYMKSVNYLCERCLKKGLYIPAKIVHHKEHLKQEDIKNPKKLYGFDNLEALCFDCHNAEHFSRENKRYEIDKQGKLIFCRNESENLREIPPHS